LGILTGRQSKEIAVGVKKTLTRSPMKLIRPNPIIEAYIFDIEMGKINSLSWLKAQDMLIIADGSQILAINLKVL
jgi:hypothetical protein